MEYLKQLDIVGTNKWLQILSLSNQELHPSGVFFKHDLCAICLNALLCTLENSLHGLRIGRHHARTSVVAYSDDVTIFVTTPTDIPKLQEAIHCF